MHFFHLILLRYWDVTFSHASVFGSVAVLGPPILSMHTTVSSLHVNVTLPLGPNGVSIRDIITSSKDGPNKHMICYIFEITHPEWAVQVSLHSTVQNTINIYHKWNDTGRKTRKNKRTEASHWFSTQAPNSAYIIIRIFSTIIIWWFSWDSLLIELTHCVSRSIKTQLASSSSSWRTTIQSTVVMCSIGPFLNGVV